MSRKITFKFNLKSLDVERLKKWLSASVFKGTHYQKILPGNACVRFTCGYYYSARQYPFNSHKEIEIAYVRQGRGAYYLAGKLYHFQKRLLLIAKPNEIHALMSVPQQGKTEWRCLEFPLGWLGLDLDVESWPHEVLLSEEEAARLDLICGQVSEEVNNRGSGYEDMIRAKFQEVCCVVRRIVSQPKKERANPLVDQLREYIDRHFTEKTSISDISKDFGYSEGYLEVAFKKTMGLSLKRYILQRRVMEARILLETKPEIKLTAIAEQVGFENYQMFHRIFKILTGVKPESYRHVIQKTVAKKDNA